MGGMVDCANRKDLDERVSLSIEEVNRLRDQFSRLCSYDRFFAARKLLSENALTNWLSTKGSTSILSSKIYNWLRSQSSNGEVNSECFITCAELFLKEGPPYQLTSFNMRRASKLEIFIHIILGKTCIVSTEEMLRESIAFTTGLTAMKNLLNLVGPTEEVDDSGVKILAETLFAARNQDVDMREFLERVHNLLPSAEIVVRRFFTWFFFGAVAPKPALLERPSALLTQEKLNLLQLALPQFSTSTGKLYLLYSSKASGLSLTRLVHALQGYPAPTLLLIRHRENSRQKCVFGLIQRSEWSEFNPEGEIDASLFSLEPRLRVYNGRENFPACGYFCRKGIAIGGVYGQSCRVWLDEEIATKSYVRKDDFTFEPGPLVEDFVETLHIDLIEAWGLGSIEDLLNQEVYRTHMSTELAPEDVRLDLLLASGRNTAQPMPNLTLLGTNLSRITAVPGMEGQIHSKRTTLELTTLLERLTTKQQEWLAAGGDRHSSSLEKESSNSALRSGSMLHPQVGKQRTLNSAPLEPTEGKRSE
eukprot:TRINITY_DN425_c0_g1_i2.p1 TRINITY_DN425_c0_g1~~TRINITY_DN425_c0_g1_i2.p1  ORF type:complete len:532 (-),score=64.57 TRINITY_DN425_c0_g1_i2:624-2219(-)